MSQVKQLKHASQCLEHEVRVLKRHGKELEGAVQERVSGELLENLKKKHAEEVAELTGKLKCFADNQKMVDNTLQLLNAKEAEVVSMKERLAALDEERSKPAPPSSSSAAARSGTSRHRGGFEARRIKQLEKHVRELEKVIQKRFPNSLSALVLAANSSSELEAENRCVLFKNHMLPPPLTEE